jgi:hypothetical protein
MEVTTCVEEEGKGWLAFVLGNQSTAMVKE